MAFVALILVGRSLAHAHACLPSPQLQRHVCVLGNNLMQLCFGSFVPIKLMDGTGVLRHGCSCCCLQTFFLLPCFCFDGTGDGWMDAGLLKSRLWFSFSFWATLQRHSAAAHAKDWTDCMETGCHLKFGGDGMVVDQRRKGMQATTNHSSPPRYTYT